MRVTLMKFLSNEIPQAFNKDLNYVLKTVKENQSKHC